MNAIVIFTFIVLWIIFSIIHNRRKKMELLEIHALSKKFNTVNQSLSKKFEELFNLMEGKKLEPDLIDKESLEEIYGEIFNKELFNKLDSIDKLLTWECYYKEPKKQEIRLIELKKEQSLPRINDYADLSVYYGSKNGKFSKEDIVFAF